MEKEDKTKCEHEMSKAYSGWSNCKKCGVKMFTECGVGDDTK